MSNQNNTSTANAKKLNVNTIIIGLLIIAIVALLGYKYMHRAPKLTIVNNGNTNASATTTPENYKTAETSASASFEGDRSKTVSFDIPESYTVVPKASKNTYAIMNGSKTVATLYYSYEGGRGYTGADYLANNVAPKVAGLSSVSTTTVGTSDYANASTANSDFRVGAYGEWLVVSESLKSNSDEVSAILKSVTVK